MIRHGNAPFLECSSRGDKRFSAFYARIKYCENRTIEDLYQSSKIFENNITGLSWKEAKGKKAINQEWCNVYYTWLWKMYIWENPAFLPILKQASGLSDVFGQNGHVCQATELWNIRNDN